MGYGGNRFGRCWRINRVVPYPKPSEYGKTGKNQGGAIMNGIMGKSQGYLWMLLSIFLLQNCMQPDSESKAPRVLYFELNDSLSRYDSLTLVLADESGKPLHTIFSGTVTKITIIKDYPLPKGLEEFQIIRSGWGPDEVDVKTLRYSGVGAPEETHASFPVGETPKTETFFLTLSQEGNGEVRPAGKFKVVGSVGVRAIPGDGFHFKKWLLISGKAEIADTMRDTTVILLREGDAEVAAVFDSIPPPAVTIAVPAPGAIFAQGKPIGVKVIAGDSGGTVRRVILTWRNLTFGKDGTVQIEAPPFEHAWDSLLGGQYALTVRALGEKDAEGHDSIHFTVHSAPVVESKPQNLSVAAGDSAHFRVKLVEGVYPEPAFSWKKGGESLPASGSQLGLASVTYGDAGTYSVLLSNAAGSVEVKDIALIVKDVIPPLLELVGSADMVIAVYSFFADPGAKAMDDKDGNVTHKIKVSGVVNPNQVGKYSLVYSVGDDS